MWAALAGWEDCVIDARLDVLGICIVLSEKDQPGARAAESLVRRSRHDVAVLEWVLELPRGDEPRGMRNIGHQPRAMLVAHFLECVVFPVTGVRARAADDETGFEEAGLGGEGGVVDELGGGFEAVWEGLEVDGGGGDFPFGGVVAVGEVTAVGEAEAHDAILGLD